MENIYYKDKAFLVAETCLQNYLAGIGEYGEDIEAALYIFSDAGVDVIDHFNLDKEDAYSYFHIEIDDDEYNEDDDDEYNEDDEY